MSDDSRHRALAARAAAILAGRAALLALLALAACSETTSPPPPPATISFAPAADDVQVPLSGQQVFQVLASAGPAPAASFYRGSTLLAAGTSYIYSSQQVGPDSLRAEVAADGTPLVKRWRIFVDAGYGDVPAPVQGLLARPGLEPGGLRVTWTRAAPNMNPRPVVEYQVAVSYDAPLTEVNWPGDALLETVAYDPQALGYTRDYKGLAMTRTAHVGVRARDETGALAPLGATAPARVPGAWRLEGTVADIEGDPLPNLRVSVGDCVDCTGFTLADGRVSLPNSSRSFRDIDKVVLTVVDEQQEAVGRWYDFVSDSLSAGGAYPLAITMIPARDGAGETLLQTACGPYYLHGGVPEFLLYVQDMTRTTSLSQPLLMKWESWPVRWWVRQPAWSDSGGFDNVPLLRAAAAAWNAVVGGPCFVEVADSAAADLRVEFRDFSTVLFGETRIVEPFYGGVNSLVPERMQVSVRRNLNEPGFAGAVILHELGHTLCLGDHSDCDQPLQVLRVGATPLVPAGGYPQAADFENVIAPEERLAIRLVRRLEQYTNMHHYQLD